MMRFISIPPPPKKTNRPLNLEILIRKGSKMNPKTDKLVRRTAMVATVTASYFLLTADYGPGPSALDPIKNAILSAEQSVKNFFFGPRKETQDGETKKLGSSTAEKHQ